LHNLALVNIEKDPDDSFKKLNYLLKNPPCPPESGQPINFILQI